MNTSFSGSKRKALILVFVLILIGAASIYLAIQLTSQKQVSPEDSEASTVNYPKIVVSSARSITQDTAVYYRNVDALQSRFAWESVQTGHGSTNAPGAATNESQLQMSDFNFSEIGQYIRNNYSYGKTTIPGILLRGDFYWDCATYQPYQSMPRFLLTNSVYNPIPGNPHTAVNGDDSDENPCVRGANFVWDITYKQVNYMDPEVKNAEHNMIMALSKYLRTENLDNTGMKLIDAVPAFEISVGHMGETRPVWKEGGHSGSFPIHWGACTNYNPNNPGGYSDYCHYTQNGYNASNWSDWQSWLIDQYQQYLGSSTEVYFNYTGGFATTGDNARAIMHATNLGVGLKTTGLAGESTYGTAREYATWGAGDNGFTYANWWSVQRNHWNDTQKPPIVMEQGVSDIAALDGNFSPLNPNAYYWFVLRSLSLHADQLQFLLAQHEPAAKADRDGSNWNIGVNDETVNWAKPYIATDTENSPGAFVVFRENKLLDGKVSNWHSPSEVNSKWTAGPDSGCYYCDRGDDFTPNEDNSMKGNFDFFMSADDGRGGQNTPQWNIPGRYDSMWLPQNGQVKSGFYKESLFYRQTDKNNNYNDFCINLDDQFRNQNASNTSFAVKVRYRNDNVRFKLVYDSNKQTAEESNSGGSDKYWITKTFQLSDANFNNSLNFNNRNYDFCVRRTGGSENLALHMVEVIPPSGNQTNVASPTMNPNGGSYQNSVTVSIETSTPSAVIRYTTNGSTPNESSSQYTTPLSFTTDTTLKARAYKAGLNPSNVTTQIYTITTPPTGTVTTPTITPGTGTYTGSVSVTMSTTTTGAQIRYTTDGSEPTENSTLYTDTFTLSSTTTVKAKGFKSGVNPSTTNQVIYTINAGTLSYCTTYDLHPLFDGRDGGSIFDNKVSFNLTESNNNYLSVRQREKIVSMTPGTSSNISSCWGRIVFGSNNQVMCNSSQVFCTWNERGDGQATLKGQDPAINGGCKIEAGVYKAQIYLKNSSGNILDTCNSLTFAITNPNQAKSE